MQLVKIKHQVCKLMDVPNSTPSTELAKLIIEKSDGKILADEELLNDRRKALQLIKHYHFQVSVIRATR